MLFAILFSATAIADDLTVVQTASEADYMVIDVSGGKDAASYPVTYYKAAQGVTSAVFNIDEYKLHKIVFKKVIVGDFMQTEGADPQPYTFRMGNCNTETGNAWHPVRLTKNYWLGVFELTQQQYTDVVGSNPSSFKTVGSAVPSIQAEIGSYGIHPVENTSYDTYASGCFARLSDRTGLTVGAPTEAQWEYACRAGTVTKYYWGSDTLSSSGRYVEGDYGWTAREMNPYGLYAQSHHAVGTLLPNAWGFYDMGGNVSEKCSDIYVAIANSTTVVSEDPTGAATGANRVERGGGYSYGQSRMASGDRQQRASNSPGSGWNGNDTPSHGVRLAVTIL